MRKYIYILMCLIVCSCYEDNSSTNIEDINPIVITFANDESNTYHRVYILDTLEISPIIYKHGTPDAKLSYEWVLQGNAIIPTVIGTEMTLKAPITVSPNSLDYYLLLTVTDDETGIKSYREFKLNVSSSYAEGLIVADTKDGVNSDLSIVISRCFNSNVDKTSGTRIVYGAYSGANGELIPGLVRDVHSSNYSNARQLTILTDRDVIKGDHYDYKKNIELSSENAFYIAPDDLTSGRSIEFNPTTQLEFINIGNGMYPRSLSRKMTQHSHYLIPPDATEYSIKFTFGIQYVSTLHAYDESKHRMLYFNSDKSPFAAPQQLETALFDVNDLSDYEVLALGQGRTSTEVNLLAKHKTTNKIYSLVMNRVNPTATTNMAKRIIDYSDSEDILNAKYFTYNKGEDVIYYATDTKLYGTPSNLVSILQYETKPGEVITSIRAWYHPTSTTDGRIDYQASNSAGFSEVNSENRVIILTTHNESTGEGRVVVIPVVRTNAAELEDNPAFYDEFGGFGRILQIARQDK